MARSWHTIEIRVDPKQVGSVAEKLPAISDLADYLNKLGIEPGQILFPPFPVEFPTPTTEERERGAFRFYALVWAEPEKVERWSIWLKG